MEGRGHEGEEDSFGEGLNVEEDSLPLGPASGSAHPAAVHRACAGLLWAGPGTYPSRPQDCFPQ